MLSVETCEQQQTNRGGVIIGDSENRRRKNRSALEDYLDSGLQTLHPNSPDPDMLPDDNAKGSRALLKNRQIARLDDEDVAGEHESHRLLLNVMVEPRSWLARLYPLEHHDLACNVFGAPAGYQELLAMERSEKTATRKRAVNCRAGLERVLDYLDGAGHDLAVKYVPAADTKEAAVVESRHETVRQIYDRELKRTGSASQAVKAAAAGSGYGDHNVRKITRDLRSERHA